MTWLSETVNSWAKLQQLIGWHMWAHKHVWIKQFYVLAFVSAFEDRFTGRQLMPFLINQAIFLRITRLFRKMINYIERIRTKSPLAMQRNLSELSYCVARLWNLLALIERGMFAWSPDQPTFLIYSHIKICEYSALTCWLSHCIKPVGWPSAPSTKLWIWKVNFKTWKQEANFKNLRNIKVNEELLILKHVTCTNGSTCDMLKSHVLKHDMTYASCIRHVMNVWHDIRYVMSYVDMYVFLVTESCMFFISFSPHNFPA